MTSKSEILYQAVLEAIHENLPKFQPSASMSDWEPATRNAFKEIFPQVKIYGCLFHYTQRIWAKTQSWTYSKFQKFSRNCSLHQTTYGDPFLPASLINPTFASYRCRILKILKCQKLRSYCKNRWLNRICPEELSIYDIRIATNNGAESYHSKLKSIIRTSHPRIWTFMATLNAIIQDTYNDIGRLRMYREISWPRKEQDIKNSERRSICKQKLSDGNYTPW